ncbi:MAG: DUF5335 family protein [Terriglobales bacterium]
MPENQAQQDASETGDMTIPSNEWKSFLDGFSRQHDMWVANIVVTLDGKQLVEAKECRLEGVSPDKKTANDRLHVMVICQNGDHLDHSIEKPSSITFRRDANGAHVGLDITSADGSQTILRFRAPARPETLDGVVAA